MTETTTDRGGAPAPHRHLPMLRNRFEIDPTEPLPGLAAGSIPAFAATDLRSPDRPLFAYVCRSELPIRHHPLNRLRKTSPAALLPLIDAGAVDWPPSGRREMAVVYQRPLGGSLAARFATRAHRPAEHEIGRRIVVPVVRALRSLETLGFPHRGIRPDNLFYMDEGCSELVLGDCVTSPPGFAQPAALETIERAMASPAGRGEGSRADDLYALGVTLVLLLTGDGGLTDDASLLAAKVTGGSFAALCGRRRLPSAMIEPLRGLLADDPARRWTLEHLEKWLAGQVRSPPQGGAGPIAPSPFFFAGRPYASTRLLAQALGDEIGEAARVIRAGELHAWLVRQAHTEETARSVADAVSAHRAARGTPQGGDDYLVARVAAALDPRGPLRFRGLRCMYDGFGPALAVCWLIDGDRRTPADAVALGLVDMTIADALQPARRRMASAETSLARLLEQGGYGGGLERCLYATNPGLSCRSPLVADAHVTTDEDLLAALEEAVERSEPLELPIDTHIAAFIAARAERDLGVSMRALAGRRHGDAVLACLALLASLQNRHDAPALPALARWFAAHLQEVVERFKARSHREELRRRLSQVASQGRLGELHALVDDPKRRRADNQGAGAAAAEFALAEERIQQYRATAVARRRRCRDMGQQAAATLSAIAGFTAVWAALVLRIW